MSLTVAQDVEDHDASRRSRRDELLEAGWLSLMDSLDAAERAGDKMLVLSLIDLILDVFNE